jgi:adenosylhomocysteine nucleosidase
VSVTGIVAALTAEARTLGQVPAPHAASGAPAINILATHRLLAISGMGPKAAARAAEALVAAGADGLLSFGLAGALDPQLRAGALVLPDTVIDGAGGVHGTYGLWRERLAVQAARAADTREVAGGTLLSVAQPLRAVAAKIEARAASGACAVDMESYAIAEVAARMGVRFAVARVVIDRASDALPLSVLRATGAYGDVNLPRLLVGLLRSPGDLPLLLRLPLRYRAALRVLRALGQVDIGLP